MQSSPSIQSGDKIILFDAVCRLCSGWSRFIARHDRDRVFRLCSVQSPAGQAILAGFDLPTDRYETMVYVENGRAYTRTDGVLRVVRRLPFPWRALVIARIVPSPLRDWLYDRIALNRYRLFGRYAQCMVPSPELMDRFIDHG